MMITYQRIVKVYSKTLKKIVLYKIILILKKFFYKILSIEKLSTSGPIFYAKLDGNAINEYKPS